MTPLHQIVTAPGGWIPLLFVVALGLLALHTLVAYAIRYGETRYGTPRLFEPPTSEPAPVITRIVQPENVVPIEAYRRAQLETAARAGGRVDDEAIFRSIKRGGDAS